MRKQPVSNKIRTKVEMFSWRILKSGCRLFSPLLSAVSTLRQRSAKPPWFLRRFVPYRLVISKKWVASKLSPTLKLNPVFIPLPRSPENIKQKVSQQLCQPTMTGNVLQKRTETWITFQKGGPYECHIV